MNDNITLCFPAKTEYIPSIRLAVSGILNHLDMDVLQIENIKSCITESCMLLICSQKCNVFHITVNVTDDDLRFEVHGSKTEKIPECKGCMNFNAELSKMMIKTLSTSSELIHDELGALTKILFDISLIG